MAWRSPVIHFSHLQSPVRLKSRLSEYKTTPLAPIRFVAHRLFAFLTTNATQHPPMLVPCIIHAVAVVSVRNDRPFRSARSMQCKYVSAKIGRLSILLPFHSHFCLSPSLLPQYERLCSQTNFDLENIVTTVNVWLFSDNCALGTFTFVTPTRAGWFANENCQSWV